MFAKYALLLVPALALAQPAATMWTPELQMKVRSVDEVTPSPDGRWALWTQTEAVMEAEKSENRTHIWLGRTDGSRRLQLTRGEKSATSPQWSTDGQHIYFASDRTGKRALYRIAVQGGEAETAFEWKGGNFSAYQLSPNGKLMAFVGTEEDAATERNRRARTDFKVIDEYRPAGLYVADLNTKAVRKLYAGEHVGSFDWSPDGARIAFDRRPNPDLDLLRKVDIAEVTVETGIVTAIATTPATESQPKYSPDGRYLAFTRSAVPANTQAPVRIVLMNRKDGTMRELLASKDESPTLLDWMPDSSGILFTEPRGTRNAVSVMPVDGPARDLMGGPGVRQSIRLNATGTHVGAVWQSPTDAPEAYVSKLGSTDRVRVSAANMDLPKLPLGETKVITWKSKDGAAVEGILTLPVGYQPGTKVPLILNIHGGPAGAFNEAFIAGRGLYPIASFAAKGYAVLRPNPRGSVGYGRKFRSANLQDWGGGDYQDLMSGVDALVAQGVADPNKLAVMGWSYGGYMTCWVVSQTTRFKAAAMGAGLANMVSMYNTNDIPSVLDDYFAGAPWEKEKGYLERSGLYHVKNVTTPTLILHGENDPRVPVTQGLEFYTALKRRGVKTQMVTYPRTQHSPQEPKFLENIMQRHLAWVEEHVK